MRRKVFILAAMMLIASFVLSACGIGGGTSKTEKIDWSEITPATDIVFWHNHSGDRELVLNKIVDDFNKPMNMVLLFTPKLLVVTQKFTPR